MLQLEVKPTGPAFRHARHTVQEELVAQGTAPEQARALTAVVGELLGAAYDSHVTVPVLLTVETFAQLTSVRVHCLRNLTLVDWPFRLRERVLYKFTIAFGQRQNVDGSTDLWAELPNKVLTRDATTSRALATATA